MAEANWYYAEGDQRNGPVAGSVIARLVADGKLVAADLIWKEGMPEWIAVDKVPALVKYLKATAPAQSAVATAVTPMPAETSMYPVASAPTPAEAVGYYNPGGSLPPRAAAALRGHATPRGDLGDWPLDDARVAQFEEALKLRKRLDAAASLFKLLALLTAIASVLVVIGALAAMGSRATTSGSIALFIAVGFCVAFVVLYYFAWKYTARAYHWAPLTMGILFSLAGVLNVIQFALLSVTTPAAIPVAVFSICLACAFAYVSFRAFASITPYLRQPAWCQELLSKTSK